MYCMRVKFRSVASCDALHQIDRFTPTRSTDSCGRFSWCKTILPLVPLPPPPRLTTRLRLRRCWASPDECVHGIAASRCARRWSIVNTHPVERWLAWARSSSWVSNPAPSESGEEDRFTAVPTRRTNVHHRKGAEMILHQ
jgi:hypothetical protein